MSQLTRPCPWPRQGTISYRLARYLTGRAVQSGGVVDLWPLRAETGWTTRQIGMALRNLRTTYKYYVKAFPNRANVFECALEWPYQIVEGGQFKLVYDPRLDSAVKHKTKFRGPPAPGSILHDIYRYILLHRTPTTHFLVATTLYKRYGAKTVQRKFEVLNKFHGFEIRKPIAKLKDNTWIINKNINHRVNSPVDDTAFPTGYVDEPPIDA